VLTCLTLAVRSPSRAVKPRSRGISWEAARRKP
jgi:hypothetical protein